MPEAFMSLRIGPFSLDFVLVGFRSRVAGEGRNPISPEWRWPAPWRFAGRKPWARPSSRDFSDRLRRSADFSDRKNCQGAWNPMELGKINKGKKREKRSISGTEQDQKTRQNRDKAQDKTHQGHTQGPGAETKPNSPPRFASPRLRQNA